MKKILIIIPIALIAVFAYQQINSNTSSNSITASSSNTSTQKEVTATTVKAVNDLVLENDPTQAAPNPLISAAAPDAEVFFIEPINGAVVNSPVSIKFGARNMQIVPAGTNEEFSGHHHLLIDLDTLPDLSQPLPATDQLKHYGGGQTETTLDLEPGTHTLQLLLGNYLHIPHDQAILSEKITITVQ